MVKSLRCGQGTPRGRIHHIVLSGRDMVRNHKSKRRMESLQFCTKATLGIVKQDERYCRDGGRAVCPAGIAARHAKRSVSMPITQSAFSSTISASTGMVYLAW